MSLEKTQAKADVQRSNEEHNDRQQQAPLDEPTPDEISYEVIEAARDRQRQGTTTGDLIDTAHTDGSTTDPALAQEQGLVYDPPADPPVLPSSNHQGAQIAAGFAGSMEEVGANAHDLPARIDGNDLNVEQEIDIMLKTNSETANLTQIEVDVRDGIAFLTGTVPARSDRAIVEEMLRDMTNVADVRNELDVAATA